MGFSLVVPGRGRGREVLEEEALMCPPVRNRLLTSPVCLPCAWSFAHTALFSASLLLGEKVISIPHNTRGP